MVPANEGFVDEDVGTVLLEEEDADMIVEGEEDDILYICPLFELVMVDSTVAVTG